MSSKVDKILDIFYGHIYIIRGLEKNTHTSHHRITNVIFLTIHPHHLILSSRYELLYPTIYLHFYFTLDSISLFNCFTVIFFSFSFHFNLHYLLYI